MRKFGCFKNFLLYLETLLHITRLVFVIRKKLMSESSQNSTQILLDGKNGSPNSKQHLSFMTPLLYAFLWPSSSSCCLFNAVLGPGFVSMSFISLLSISAYLALLFRPTVFPLYCLFAFESFKEPGLLARQPSLR